MGKLKDHKLRWGKIPRNRRRASPSRWRREGATPGDAGACFGQPCQRETHKKLRHLQAERHGWLHVATAAGWASPLVGRGRHSARRDKRRCARVRGIRRAKVLGRMRFCDASSRSVPVGCVVPQGPPALPEAEDLAGADSHGRTRRSETEGLRCREECRALLALLIAAL